MTADLFGGFGTNLRVDSGEPVVGVRGDVDVLTAPMLNSVLDVLVEQGHTRIVIDLAALTFMDASGLRVLADLANRVAQSGGVLTVRSAPKQTRRILDITKVSDIVRVETAVPVVAALGPEQRSGDHSQAVGATRAMLSSDLARVGAIHINRKVVDAALGMVASLASKTVEGANGVSVTLKRHGRLMTVGASDDTILQMDAHQYATGEGPCLSAAAEGRWFHVESLASESRWPAFIPRAIEEGIASILSTPLMAVDQPVGALNIYSSRERAFGEQQQELAALFATQASRILSDAGDDVSEEELGERIDDALRAREVIAPGARDAHGTPGHRGRRGRGRPPTGVPSRRPVRPPARRRHGGPNPGRVRPARSECLMSEPADLLERARQDTGLSMRDLWFRYFALGGMSTALEVEAYLHGALIAATHDRDLLAVALNERYAELGRDHPLAYSHEEVSGH